MNLFKATNVPIYTHGL